jgi:hypothetical protein
VIGGPAAATASPGDRREHAVKLGVAIHYLFLPTGSSYYDGRKATHGR